MAEQDNISSFLLEFSKALRAYNLYPTGHPALASQARNLHALLVEAGGGVHFPVELELSRSGFSLAGKPLSGMPVVSALANHLYKRRLRKVTILSGITSDELHEFLQIVSLSEDEIRTLGGIKKILEIRQVSNIGIVEVSYQEVVHDEELVPPLELEEEVPLELEEITPDADEQDKLDVLLEEIRKEEDEVTLTELLSDFMEVLRPLIDLERRNAALKALDALTEIVADSRTSPGKRALIEKAFSQLFNIKTMSSLLHWLAYPEGGESIWILDIFRSAGEILLPNLIGALVRISRGKLAKLPLSEFLTLYPEDEIISLLIERIRSGSPSQVNNSVYILGILRNEKVVPVMRELLDRDEETLSWEVVSCLSQIGGNAATRILLNFYFSAAAGLKSHILLTLGVIGGEEAFQFLSQVALGDSSPVFRKSAIEALGSLRNAGAVKLLSRILKKKSWLNRVPPELKAQSALSIAEIGSNHALATLIEAAEQRYIARGNDVIWDALGKLEEKVGFVSGS